MAGRPHKYGTRAPFPDTRTSRRQATRSRAATQGCSAAAYTSGVEGRSPQAKIAVSGAFQRRFATALCLILLCNSCLCVHPSLLPIAGRDGVSS